MPGSAPWAIPRRPFRLSFKIKAIERDGACNSVEFDLTTWIRLNVQWKHRPLAVYAAGDGQRRRHDKGVVRGHELAFSISSTLQERERPLPKQHLGAVDIVIPGRGEALFGCAPAKSFDRHQRVATPLLVVCSVRRKVT
jgi:hypothetical protein